MYKKRAILVILAMLIMAAGILIWQRQAKSNLSNDEIQRKFNCKRFTTDIKKTDYYCHNPDAYRSGEPIPEGWMGI